MKSYLRILGICLIVFFTTLTLKTLFFIVFNVPSNSMFPALHPGDRVLILKKARIKRDDIWAFRFPDNKDVFFIKRCKGIPGDKMQTTLKAENKISFYINRSKYGHRSFIIPYKGMAVSITGGNLFYAKLANKFESRHFDSRPGGTFENGKSVEYYRFRQNYYFFLGDNSIESYDSRFWGLVPEALLEGKAYCVLANFKTYALQVTRVLLLL